MGIRNSVVRFVVSALGGVLCATAWLVMASVVRALLSPGETSHDPSWFMPLVAVGVLVALPLGAVWAFAAMTPRPPRRPPAWSMGDVPLARPIGPVPPPVSDVPATPAFPAEGESASATFQLDDEDLLAAQRYLKRNSPTNRRVMLAGVVIVFLMLALYQIPTLRNDITMRERLVQMILNLVIYGFFAVTVLAALSWVERRSIARAIRGPGGAADRSPTVVTVSADSLRSESASETSIRRWHAVYQVARNDEFIVLYVGPHIAHFVPLRAFASQADAERFFQLAQRYREAAAPDAASRT
ncbi:MAG: YcxB family protein [Phycisphaerae bacterium]|nr:YcxB family protein [Phycisphaerae bacterium]